MSQNDFRLTQETSKNTVEEFENILDSLTDEEFRALLGESEEEPSQIDDEMDLEVNCIYFDHVAQERQYGINFLDITSAYLVMFDKCDIGKELEMIVQYIFELTQKYRTITDRIASERGAELKKSESNHSEKCKSLALVRDEKITLCQDKCSNSDRNIEAKRRKETEKYKMFSEEQVAQLEESTKLLSKGGVIDSLFHKKRNEEQLRQQKERIAQLVVERERIYQECMRTFDDEKQTAKEERDKEIQNITRSYNSELEMENKAYEVGQGKIKHKYDEVLSRGVKDNLSKALFCYFESEKFTRRMEKLLNLRDSYNQYTVPEGLPEYYYICDVAYDFGMDYRFLINIIKSGSKFVRVSNLFDEKGTITIPLFQSRAEGMKVCATLDAHNNKETIREILLRQFMSFPAGKLEAVFINPQLSAAFSLFTRLGGDDYKRIIDTKVWTTESDIENALLRARERLETIISGYDGTADKAVEQRESRENFRIICVADFPSKFTVNALKELETLVKRGTAYGISVVIFYDEEELKNVDKHAEPIINSILSGMKRINNRNGVYYLIPNKETVESTSVVRRCLWDNTRDYATTEKIISEIASHVGDYKKKEVKGEEIYQDQDDINSWLIKSSKEGLVIPLGTQGKGDVVNLTLGRRGADIRHHVLVEGSTGSGKTVFLHTLICSTIRLYAPNEVQLILLDYKEGVEFKLYANYALPSFRVVSVQSEREYGAKVLEKLVDEMVERYNTFKRVLPDSAEPNIEDYRNKTNETIPRLMLIIDEFERLTIEHDDITERCLRSIKVLVEQGRAAGIHVILATQNFSLPDDIMENMAVRFACQGSSHLLQSGNDGVVQLKDGPEGQVVFNDNKGVASNNKIFQVAYLGEEKVTMLQKLSLIEEDEVYRNGVMQETQILYTRIEENRKHLINQFVTNGIVPDNPLAKKESTYPIMLGNCFDLDEKLSINLRVAKGSNLLIASEKEANARNLFDLTLVSILFADLCNKKTDSRKQSIFYIDFGEPDKMRHAEITRRLKQELSTQIASVNIDDSDDDELDEAIALAGEMINTLYSKICEIKENGYSEAERHCFLLFGINRAHLLDNVVFEEKNTSFSIYESDTNETKMTYMDKIRFICAEGPSCGVNTVMWSDNYEITSDLLGEHFEKMFDQRVVSFMPDADTKLLVLEKTSNNLGSMGAIFLGRQTSFRKFRIYDELSAEFVSRFIDTYKDAISQESVE